MTTSALNLPKLALTTSASGNPFSSDAAFVEIGAFVDQCFPSIPVKGWGTLFVISDDLEDLASQLKLAINEVLLIDDATSFESINQKVVFVASGGPSAIIAGTYSSLSDATKVVAGCNHDSAPAVLIHTSRSPRAYRFFWGGIANPSNVFTTYVGAEFAKLVLKDFSAAVSWVEEHMVCPSWNIDDLWQIPAKHVPHKDAERRVQHFLRNGLATVLGKSYIIEEPWNAAGRADLLILPPSKAFPVNYIELKVVRTYHSVENVDAYTLKKIYGARNPRWILSAIRQAAAYRGKNTNAEAHARIYDMREDKSEAIPDANAIAAAKKRNVSISVCKLHATTEAIQEENCT